MRVCRGHLIAWTAFSVLCEAPPPSEHRRATRRHVSTGTGPSARGTFQRLTHGASGFTSIEEIQELCSATVQQLCKQCVEFSQGRWTDVRIWFRLVAGRGWRRVEDGADRASGIYSIGAVSRMLGVSAQTLRAWEDRYQQIVPARSAGGQRLFSRDQVDQLSFIRDQIEQGLQPSDAHRLLAQQRQEDAVSLPVESRRGVSRASPDETITVLLAERDRYAAEFADYFLRTEGYVVRVELDPAVAAEILRDEPPSVLVVDLLMSGGVGLALCRTARDVGSVPVLAVSAVELRDQAFAAGAEAFLVKPLEALQFVSTVRDLVGTSAYLRRRESRP